jgi:small subunit ribosomal protein S27Ae
MEILEKIQSSGVLSIYCVHSPMSVKEFLNKLNLEAKFFAVIINGRHVQLTDLVSAESEITILPKIAGGGRGAKRKVKTKEKRQKTSRNKNKGPMWNIEGDKIIRTHKSCPKCGPGVFLADHYDRMHCGACGYTLFKRPVEKSSEE